ncbi:leucine zipper domain-containing protein [Corynebacterium timonense]|uniref:leucine zipper domain-containing protein n=1 Tax=Corynebacterium timonense TaxID=441500 RepID=UPI0012DF037B|nr:leucine zipper domain-containing protein [Corynebacterium timonense]
MPHGNAPLTPAGRARMVELVITRGWTQRRVTEPFQVCPATADRWVSRARRGKALTDRSSRPRSCPHQLPMRAQRRIIKLRLTRQWGTHRHRQPHPPHNASTTPRGKHT